MLYALRSTLKLWNSGTLELWNPFLNPLRGKRYGLHHYIYYPSSPAGKERKAQSVKRKEIPFMTYLSTLHPKPNALGYTLYAPRWNFGTLELH